MEPSDLGTDYPASRQLGRWEPRLNWSHAPESQKSEKTICEDAACWIERLPITPTKGLNWAVRAQSYRQGGSQVGKAIERLRARDHAAQMDSLPKEKTDFLHTEVEEELYAAPRGPDGNWLADAHKS